MLTFGSLFSGIGGLDLGLERAGWTCRWQVEIDDYCRRVLERHWPDVKRYEDVRDVGAHNLEPVSLICGGFPCQPVSLAGRQLAQRDERWLWPEFARVVRELRPRFVLVENVPGLLVRGMGDVLGDLAACGYDAEWQVLPAAAFGAPHRRERVFIVAYANGTGRVGLEEPNGTAPSHPSVWPASWNYADGLALAEYRAQEATSRVRRVDDGLPYRVERLRALGNAVVPAVAQWLGERILDADRRWRSEENRVG